MKRYCVTCETTVDFNVTRKEDLETMICPTCGQNIARNPSNPKSREMLEATAKTEMAIGQTIYYAMRIYMLISFACALAAVACYVFKQDIPLYILTAVSAAVYFFQYKNSESGVVWVVIGMAIAGFVTRTLQGVVLGAAILLMAIYVIRRLIIDLLVKALKSRK